MKKELEKTTPYTRVQCPNCNGEGVTYAMDVCDTRKCLVCKGTGIVHKYQRKRRDNMENLFKCSDCEQTFTSEVSCLRHEGETHKNAITCPDCQGRGWNYDWDWWTCRPCKSCSGVGLVIPKQTIVYAALTK